MERKGKKNGYVSDRIVVDSVLYVRMKNAPETNVTALTNEKYMIEVKDRVLKYKYRLLADK